MESTLIRKCGREGGYIQDTSMRQFRVDSGLTLLIWEYGLHYPVVFDLEDN